MNSLSDEKPISVENQPSNGHVRLRRRRIRVQRVRSAAPEEPAETLLCPLNRDSRSSCDPFEIRSAADRFDLFGSDFAEVQVLDAEKEWKRGRSGAR